ncbi:acyltransferase domain-containing protein [Buchnera aphidicola]|uniref:acyltransferase domain-containing protein n=1 Tax=Buchnera aphidicola TaxID=9 RepID=UPI0030CF674B
MIKFSMIFPGQNIQNIKMLQILYKNYPIMRNTFSEASYYLKYDLWKKISKRSFNNKKISQIEILVSSISIFRVWKKIITINPKIIVGHSLGQYSAYVCSKILKFSDAIKIVKYREKIMKSNPGFMYAIISKKKNINIILKKISTNKKIFIACINSNTQIVVTGKKKYIKNIYHICKKFKTKKIIKLPTKYISHCKSMKNIKKLLFKKCICIPFKKSKYQILDSSELKFIQNPIQSKNFLINQLCKTIQWNKTINLIISKKIKYFLEVGTSNFLNNFFIKKKKYIPLSIKKYLI